MEKDTVVNIPRDKEDPHYRYKMPSLVVKIEGRGNGIKTRLVNAVEVARALDRNPVYIVKFFGFELGAQIITPSPGETGDYLVNGKHDAEDLAKLLDRFIEKYVLCGKCRNPETVIYIKTESPRMRCKACGYRTQCDVSHKIANYIVKFPPVVPVIKSEEETIETPSIVTTDDYELENDWAVSTEPEEVAKRQLNLCGGNLMLLYEDQSEVSPIIQKISPTENPLSILDEFWQTLPTDDEVIFNITTIAKLCNWTEEATLKNIFASQFMNFTPEGAIIKARYLSLFIDSETKQKIILKSMETMASQNKNFAQRFPDILALFWEQRVLEEDIIHKWYTHTNPKTPEKVSKYIRDKSEKVIKWLKDNDEVIDTF